MTALDEKAIEQVLLGGDLSKLAAAQRLSYYQNVCESLGLNPLTRPLEYLTLNGKLVLYARKDATEQLRKRHAISVTITAREVTEGCYVVTAHAKMGDREDESIGAVPIDSLKGEARTNAMMKAETKAKRRVTLSICGLGMLDETEIESIPHAVPGLPAYLDGDAEPEPDPEGYGTWMLNMEHAADVGLATLETAWRAAKLEYRKHIPAATKDALKARAKAADAARGEK